MAIAYALPSHTILNSPLARLRSKYGLAAIVTPAKPESSGTWSITTTSQNGGTNNCGTDTSQNVQVPDRMDQVWATVLRDRQTCHRFCQTTFTALQTTSVSGHHVSFNSQFTLVCWHYRTLTLKSAILHLAYLGTTLSVLTSPNVPRPVVAPAPSLTGPLKVSTSSRPLNTSRSASVGDFTKINVPKGDSGGDLDNKSADGKFFLLLSFDGIFQTVLDEYLVFQRKRQPK